MFSSQKREANRAKLRRAIDTLNVVPFESRAADAYGTLCAALERAGTPCGPLDMLIAAHAPSLNLTLVTNNVREFARVKSLKVENWIPE